MLEHHEGMVGQSARLRQGREDPHGAGGLTHLVDEGPGGIDQDEVERLRGSCAGTCALARDPCDERADVPGDDPRPLLLSQRSDVRTEHVEGFARRLDEGGARCAA